MNIMLRNKNDCTCVPQFVISLVKVAGGREVSPDL